MSTTRRGAVLAVSAYTTAAGTRIAERTWRVRELTRIADDVELRIGGPVPE